MAYSIDSIADNCYPGTLCLINKYNIRDEHLLAETESAIVLAKMSILDQNPLQGNFDFLHYKAIHSFLFCDLYSWAGQIRSVDISKKGTVFVPAYDIEHCADACFSRLHTFSCKGLSRHEAAYEIADFYNTVNLLHPFREGNGRAQRAFFVQWIRHMGYDFDLAEADTDKLMLATIQAAHGVMDLLVEFFEETII